MLKTRGCTTSSRYLVVICAGMVILMIGVHLALRSSHAILILVLIPLLASAIAAPPRSTHLFIALTLCLGAIDVYVDSSRHVAVLAADVAILGSACVAWGVVYYRGRSVAEQRITEGGIQRSLASRRIVLGDDGFEDKSSGRGYPLASVALVGGTGSQLSRPPSAVERYIAAWNEASRPQRLLFLDECWAENGIYEDRYTSMPVEVLVNLAAYIEHVRKGTPAYQFELVGSLDEHHGYFRFNWAFRDPQGRSALRGMDFGEIDPDGRIRRVVRFHGIAPVG